MASSLDLMIKSFLYLYFTKYRHRDITYIELFIFLVYCCKTIFILPPRLDKQFIEKWKRHSTSLLKYSSAFGWWEEIHCGKSITVSWPYSFISRLNSLKSPCINPRVANFFTNSRQVLNIYFIEQFYPIFFTLHKGSPSIRDMTIAWRFVSIGFGVGNPSSCKICINTNYLIEDNLDKYSQLKLVLFWMYYRLFFIVLKDLRPSLVSFKTTWLPSNA